MDALWDCLYDLSGEPMKVRVYGTAGILKLKGFVSEYLGKILRIFDDVHRECPEITFEIIS